MESILAELIAAAREGTADDCPDWRFRPAWRQRLCAAVRNYDVATGHTVVPASREAIRVETAPKPRPVVVLSDPGADFERFWMHYPRKMEGGRLAAEKAYAKARKMAGADEILSGLLTYPFREDPAYQPNAAKWLERGCWMTERDTRPPTVVKERAGRRHEAAELAEEAGLDLVTPIGEQFPESRTDARFPARATNYSVAD